jgi:SAM-dependent methyltransferase
MDNEDGYFGERVAARYDDSHSGMCEPSVVDAAVEVLVGLAGGGRALELGIGTGRIALPLVRRSVAVHGIDLSQAMVARLRTKLGGEGIGDFATARADGTFRVAYLVFKNDYEADDAGGAGGLLPQRRGSPGTWRPLRYLVMVPDLRRLSTGQNVVPFHVSPTRRAFDVCDIATQTMSSNDIEIAGGRGEYTSTPFRYVWPAELDLMAQLAGLRLHDGGMGGHGNPSQVRAVSMSRSGRSRQSKYTAGELLRDNGGVRRRRDPWFGRLP